jgi:hypothetical protein
MPGRPPSPSRSPSPSLCPSPRSGRPPYRYRTEPNRIESVIVTFTVTAKHPPGVDRSHARRLT